MRGKGARRAGSKNRGKRPHGVGVLSRPGPEPDRSLQLCPADIGKIIAAFKTLGVKDVAPSHCTGTPARRLFQEQYGAGFIESGVGKVILGKELVR